MSAAEARIHSSCRSPVGVPLDHSFLKYKKELIPFGYTVGKISMKEQTVTFLKISEDKNTSR